jgi:hypothetical protein
MTDFRISWWSILDADSLLGLLHLVDMGDVAGALEVYAASIFMVEMYRMVSFFVHIVLFFEKDGGRGEVELDWCPVWISRDSGPEKFY